MNLFKRYVEYYKDNPQGYWFKRKLYGWGWVPVTWQGWLVLAFFILFLFWNVLSLTPNPVPTDAESFWIFAKSIFAAGIMIFICYKTGEKPRWQWGLPSEDVKKDKK